MKIKEGTISQKELVLYAYEIICTDLSAGKTLQITDFGENGDLTLHIRKDDYFDAVTENFNTVYITTWQKDRMGKRKVDYSGAVDVHRQLSEELKRINHYKNLCCF